MEQRQNILIVDDDPEIREVVRLLLTGEGYGVTEAADGAEALAAMREDIDLVILDVMMPQLSGLSVCEQLRRRYAVPILFLTAKSQDSDKTVGFSAGADDYLGKPFSCSELISRVKALLRRYCVYGAKTAKADGDVLVIGELAIRPAEGRVTVLGSEVALTDIEYRILLLLATNRKRIYSVQNIYENVWNEPYFYSSNNTVMVHIRNLRRKLAEKGLTGELVKTCWGKGYRIE